MSQTVAEKFVNVGMPYVLAQVVADEIATMGGAYLPRAGGSMTGALLATAGSIGAPGIGTVGDAASGVGQPGGANTYSVIAGGVEARVSAVGTGTAISPAAAADATSNGRNIRIVGGAGGSTSGNAGSFLGLAGTPVDGNGAAANLTATAGVGTNRNGGGSTITAGAATGSGTPGNVALTAGAGVDTAGGNVTATAGAATGTAAGGAFIATGGNATNAAAASGEARIVAGSHLGAGPGGIARVISGGTASGTPGYIDFRTTTGAAGTQVSRFTVQGAGHFWPADDNTYDLGSGALRMRVIYAGTGTINTSDARAKQDVRALSAKEKAAAIRVKGLLKAYRFRDAVAEKGDAARIHFGVIAQDLKAAFEAEGLDAERYGLFCHDRWDADPGHPGELEQPEVRDEDGNIVTPHREALAPTPPRPAGDRMGVRYDEMFAFLLAAL